MITPKQHFMVIRRTWSLRLVLMERVKAAKVTKGTVLLFSLNLSSFFSNLKLQWERTGI